MWRKHASLTHTHTLSGSLFESNIYIYTVINQITEKNSQKHTSCVASPFCCLKIRIKKTHQPTSAIVGHEVRSLFVPSFARAFNQLLLKTSQALASKFPGRCGTPVIMPNPPGKTRTQSDLVGGWTNPFEKYARQIGSVSPGRDDFFLKPPTSHAGKRWSMMIWRNGSPCCPTSDEDSHGKTPCLNYLLERGRRFVQAKLTQTFEMMLWKWNFSLKVEDETISSVPARLLVLTEWLRPLSLSVKDVQHHPEMMIKCSFRHVVLHMLHGSNDSWISKDVVFQCRTTLGEADCRSYRTPAIFGDLPSDPKKQTSAPRKGTFESINHFSHGENMLISYLISHHYKGHHIFHNHPNKHAFWRRQTPSKLPYILVAFFDTYHFSGSHLMTSTPWRRQSSSFSSSPKGFSSPSVKP